MSLYPNITFNTNINLDFYVGQFVQLVHDLENYIYGQVLSYDSSTGVIIIQPTNISGSGYFDSWYLVSAGGTQIPTSFQGTTNNVISLPLTPLDSYLLLVNPSADSLETQNLDNIQIQY